MNWEAGIRTREGPGWKVTGTCCCWWPLWPLPSGFFYQSNKRPTMHHCCSSLWWQPNKQKQVVFSCKMYLNHRGAVYHHSNLTIRIESQNTVALLYLSPHVNKDRQIKPSHRFHWNHPKSCGRTFSRTIQTPAAVGQKQDQYLHSLTWLFQKWQQFWSRGAKVKCG